MKKRPSLILIAVLLLSAFVGLYSVSNLPLVHATGAITQIQTARGTSTSSYTVSVTMGSAPVSGDVLIATFSDYSGSTGPISLSSITETGVTWSSATGYYHASAPGLDNEIWYGIVGSGASKSITFTNLFSDTTVVSIADVVEYSGLLTTNPFDASNYAKGTSTTTSTGITGTTSVPNELCVGSIVCYGDAQGSPTNGFTLVDGVLYTGISEAYLQNIVSSTGAYSTGTTAGGGSSYYIGCIATFKGTPSESITITSSPATGSGFVTVDGNPITTPYMFTWFVGDTHTIAANSPVSGYTFSSWSDSGAQSHTYTVPANSATVTANYIAPSSITITSSPATGTGFISVDSSPITTPYIFTWAVGGTHTLAATSPVSGGTGTQYVWSSWSNSGTQTQTYTVPSSSITVTASYTTQYYVTTSGDAYTTITASSWQNSGATPTITYSATSGHSILYVSVNGGANIVGTYPSSYTFPALSSPQSIAVATSITTYTITVTSAYGNPTPTGTAPLGTNYATSVTSPQVINAYENAVCIGYSVDGGSLVSGTSYTFVDVTSGHAITYEWEIQYTSPGGSGISTGDGGQIAGGSIFDVQATNSSAAQAAGSGTSSNLVGYWAFDEGSGTTAHDSSGNGNTGTLINSPSWVAGKYGDALSFNGANYVDVSMSVIAQTHYTISAWINPSTISGNQPIVTEWSSPYNFVFEIRSSLYFQSYSGGGALSGNSHIATNTWSFVTITWDGTTCKDYINGVLDNSATGNFNLPVSSSHDLQIGHNFYDNTYFHGSIDNVMIYNTALTQAQITQLYNWQGSTCTVSTVQPNFQSFSTTVSLYQGQPEGFYTGSGNTNWDAPTYDFNTGYLEYGVNYVDPTTGTLCPGWYVKISVIGGKAGTFSGSNDAYVELQCSWYDNGVLAAVPTDLFCAYDAYRANDTTTQFELYINLWLSNQNGNSYVGGAVTAEYYGTTSTGWGPWSSWGPVDGLLCQSTFYAPLYNSNGTVIAASSLQSGTSPADFNVWTKIAKTGIGYGPYSDDLHVWATTCHDLTFNDLPSGAILVGMNAPPILPTSTPNNPVGIFAQIGNSITAALNTMSQTLSTMTSSASGVTASVLNSAFATMGVPNAVTSIQNYASSIGGYFSQATTTMGSVVYPIFTGIATWGMWFITAIAGFIGIIISIATFVMDILTGHSTGNSAFGNFGPYGNILGQTVNIAGQGFNVITLLFITTIAGWLFVAAWWFDSIDKRAKQYGGGWMSFFMSDIQQIISVLSFIFDTAWMIITAIINLGSQFLNLFL